MVKFGGEGLKVCGFQRGMCEGGDHDLGEAASIIDKLL